MVSRRISAGSLGRRPWRLAAVDRDSGIPCIEAKRLHKAHRQNLLSGGLVKRRVRFLVDPPMTGAQNMARDLELLAEGVPTVRLYAWKPACVSLGYAQPEADVDLDVAREFGLDVVRRPTGGGAILHEEDEVTYSVVLPKGLGPADLF